MPLIASGEAFVWAKTSIPHKHVYNLYCKLLAWAEIAISRETGERLSCHQQFFLNPIELVGFQLVLSTCSISSKYHSLGHE